jgi:hypothetical protein
MKGLTLLAFVVIGLFIVLLGFSLMEDKNEEQKNVLVKPLELKKLDHEYSLQRQENRLEHEKSLTKQELEYNAYLRGQEFSQTETLEKQKLDFQAFTQLQALNQQNIENQQNLKHEVEKQRQVLMHQTLSEREQLENKSSMQQQDFNHKENILFGKTKAEQQKLYTWAAAGVLILSIISAIIFLLFRRYKDVQVKLSLLSYEHISELEDKKSYHEVRMKILDSINNFSEEEKKEIIFQLIPEAEKEKQLAKELSYEETPKPKAMPPAPLESDRDNHTFAVDDNKIDLGTQTHSKKTKPNT